MSLNFFDWVKRRTLVALFSSASLRAALVLKGGNLLDIAFQVSARSSIDLDFSIEGEFLETQTVRAECETVLTRSFREVGYHVLDVTLEERPPEVSEDIRSFWGGYRVYFKLLKTATYDQHEGDLESLRRNATPLTADGSTRFRIDISKFEYCGGAQAFQIDGVEVVGYSPEMVVAEKLRAICQQMPAYRATVHKTQLAGRARDFLDIYLLRESFLINFENPGFQELVKMVFAKKRVPLRLIREISSHADDHRGDFVAVQATVKAGTELNDFDFYVEYVARACGPLESLGDV